MTEAATFESLMAVDNPKDNTELFELPSGLSVEVRGLTRFELMFNGKGTEDSFVIEARNVHSCLIEPVLTYDQVRQWQNSSRAGGDFRALSEKIRDLSGLGEGADKSDPGATGE